MAYNFTTVQQEIESNGVKILAYGKAGSGKTVMSVTAPRPVIISAEGGLLSLNKPNLIRLFGADNPTITYEPNIITIENYQDLLDVHAWLLSNPEARNFQTVCLDSLSEIAEVLLEVEKRDVKDPRMAYGKMIEKMTKIIRIYKQLPFHIYMTAKMEATKDELAGTNLYGPLMPGQKLGPSCPYFFDEVFRVGIQKNPQGQSYRFLQTELDFQHDAKDRSGMLLPLEVPNLTNIINKIQGL